MKDFCKYKHVRASECPLYNSFSRKGPVPWSEGGRVDDYLDLKAYSEAHGATDDFMVMLQDHARSQKAKSPPPGPMRSQIENQLEVLP